MWPWHVLALFICRRFRFSNCRLLPRIIPCAHSMADWFTRKQKGRQSEDRCMDSDAAAVMECGYTNAWSSWPFFRPRQTTFWRRKRNQPSPFWLVKQRFDSSVFSPAHVQSCLSIARTRLYLVAARVNTLASYEKRYQPPADRVWTQRPSRHLHLSTPHYHGNYSRHLAALPD